MSRRLKLSANRRWSSSGSFIRALLPSQSRCRLVAVPHIACHLPGAVRLAPIDDDALTDVFQCRAAVNRGVLHPLGGVLHRPVPCSDQLQGLLLPMGAEGAEVAFN